MVPGLEDGFKLLNFEKLELMTLPLKAGSQEVASKLSTGL
jgi:hypothetical protein